MQFKLYTKPKEILECDSFESYCIKPDYRKTPEEAIQAPNKRIIILNSVKEAFKNEMNDFDWFTEEYVSEVIDEFVNDFDMAFDKWREEYKALNLEFEQNNRHLIHIKADSDTSYRNSVITKKLENMREGKDGFYTYRYLGAEGFLPNYAFPRNSCGVSFYDIDDEISRDRVLALREFAPGNSIYYKNYRYMVTFAKPRTVEGNPDFKKALVCPSCNEIHIYETHQSYSNDVCSNCGFSLEDIHPMEHVLEMPNMVGKRKSNITSDEEERTRLGYDIQPHYVKSQQMRHYEVKTKDGHPLCNLTYEHNGRIVIVNKGSRTASEEGDYSGKGFVLCKKCNKWLLSDKAIEQHINPESDGPHSCLKGATGEDVVRLIELYTETYNDVLTLKFTFDGKNTTDEFYKTFMYAFTQGIQVTFNVDENEINSFLVNDPSSKGEKLIVLYETAPGGEGILEALKNKQRFQDVVERILEIIHYNEDGCERACYDCLCNYYNQSDHLYLNRKAIIPILEQAQNADIISLDNNNKYNELLSKCESSLERKVIDWLKDKGFRLPDEAQKPIYIDNTPIAEADFYYNNKIIVFVDGDTVHRQDYVHDSDTEKRRILKSKGYRIIVLREAFFEDDLIKLCNKIN